MQMRNSMNSDGTMAVTAVYSCEASVNVRNSASDKEIKDAFAEACLLASQKAIGECGAGVKANVVERAIEKKAKKAKKTENTKTAEAVAQSHPTPGPLANAGSLKDLL